MRFIQEYGYTVKVGQEEAHQKWLVDNNDALAKSMPAGTRYIGTFAVVYSSEKSSGWYRTLLELDSYAAMDKLAVLNKDPNSEYGSPFANRRGSATTTSPRLGATRCSRMSSTRPSGIRRPEACLTVSAAGSGRRPAGRGMPRPRRTHCRSSGDVLGRPRRVERPDLTGRGAHLGISKATPRSAHT